MKKYLIPIIVIVNILVLVVGIFIGKKLENYKLVNDKIITAKDENSYIINLDTVKKVTISYMSDSKVLSNDEKDNLVSKLKKVEYPVVNEPGLVISSEYKVDFNNGIYFTFGEDVEIKVYEYNIKKFTSKLSDDILDTIRNKFNPNDYSNDDNKNLMVNVLVMN